MKLKKIATEGSSLTTEYAGNYVYKNGVLEFFNHAEGYVEKEADGYKYVYQYKDHLGNIRLSYKDADKDGTITTSEIVEEKNYYPFGLQHKGYNFAVNGRKHNYDYLGQERQEELGLNWHSYKWRNADPAIGRFFGVDPITEDYPNQTPYQFASNNPVWKIEIEGLEGYAPSGNDIINGQGFSIGHVVFNPNTEYRQQQEPLQINNGVMTGHNVVNDITSVTERPKMGSIDGIVLHRTVSSTAQSAIQTTKNNGGYTGFHIVIDKDGTTTQVNNLENRANHVGTPSGELNNYNSIGVEVVGLHTGAPGENSWEPLTGEQVEQTTSAVYTLMREYNIDSDAVIPHEEASAKTPGEGGVVKNSITIYPLPKPALPVDNSLNGLPVNQ